MDRKIKQQRKVKIILFAIIISLLIALVFNGNIDENIRVYSAYGIFAFAFIATLIYTIYYKKNSRTLAFWLTIVLGILFILITLLYIYVWMLGAAMAI